MNSVKKSRAVQGRHRARELAVQLLYSLSVRPEQDLGKCLDVFISQDGIAAEEDAEIKEYLCFLAKGIWSRRLEIDNMMRQVVSGWRPERMVAVDRVVLQMAIFEGFLEKAVPVAVSISESVELASSFGTEDSGKFVNGVLGKLDKLTRKAENRAENGEHEGKYKDSSDAVKTSKVSADC